MKNTFLNTERNVLCGHFSGLVQRETFSCALVLFPQVTHHHHWFLSMMNTQTSYLYQVPCEVENTTDLNLPPHKYESCWISHIKSQTVTYLLTGTTAECLLHTSPLHLNILILIHTFLWVSLNFDLRLGRDPVTISINTTTGIVIHFIIVG